MMLFLRFLKIGMKKAAARDGQLPVSK